MSSPLIVRAETHALATSFEVREAMARTIEHYRRAVRMAATLALTHWPELGPLRANERQMALEAMFHATKQRPLVRYPVLARVFDKMPSYLRRAALHAALGAVSSFMSNWNNFLDGQIAGRARDQGARGPRLGLSGVFPTLYGGNMVLYGEGLRTVQVKLLGADGQWRFSAPLALKGRFKRLLPQTNKMDLSPSLVLRGAKASLVCPVESRPPTFITNAAFAKGAHRVCAIDVGINTAATAAIVDSTGTVIARRFFTCGRHNDRRDALAQQVADKQASSGRLARGERHAVALHRRIAGLSLDAARRIASDIAAFAASFDAKAFIIEDLKGWRPKGPSKTQRKRFHRFQHRALVKALTHKAQELGARLLEVVARGTSRWAYDGSGKVQRSKDNAQLATFATGKRYNADLNGALNIAARGLALLLGLKPERLNKQADTGKSSGSAVRMPLVLADVWAYAQTSRSGTITGRPSRRAGESITAGALCAA
jgi:putative transposase